MIRSRLGPNANYVCQSRKDSLNPQLSNGLFFRLSSTPAVPSGKLAVQWVECIRS